MGFSNNLSLIINKTKKFYLFIFNENGKWGKKWRAKKGSVFRSVAPKKKRSLNFGQLGKSAND